MIRTAFEANSGKRAVHKCKDVFPEEDYDKWTVAWGIRKDYHCEKLYNETDKTDGYYCLSNRADSMKVLILCVYPLKFLWTRRPKKPKRCIMCSQMETNLCTTTLRERALDSRATRLESASASIKKHSILVVAQKKLIAARDYVLFGSRADENSKNGAGQDPARGGAPPKAGGLAVCCAQRCQAVPSRRAPNVYGVCQRHVWALPVQHCVPERGEKNASGDRQIVR